METNDKQEHKNKETGNKDEQIKSPWKWNQNIKLSIIVTYGNITWNRWLEEGFLDSITQILSHSLLLNMPYILYNMQKKN